MNIGLKIEPQNKMNYGCRKMVEMGISYNVEKEGRG